MAVIKRPTGFYFMKEVESCILSLNIQPCYGHFLLEIPLFCDHYGSVNWRDESIKPENWSKTVGRSININPSLTTGLK